MRIALAGLALLTLAAGPAYEQPPIVLAAADTVPTELLSGEYHTVAERVENDGFMNRYRIESDFGVFEAEGNRQLEIRVKEIYAIAQLEEITRSEAFADAMEQAATRVYRVAGQAVKEPVKTAKGVSGGVKRFVKRTARQVSDLSEDVSEEHKERKQEKEEKKARQAEAEARGEEPPPEDSGLTEEEAKEYAEKGAEVGETYAKKWLGYTGARRRWAKEMGVDPYTDNEVLNKELYRVAQAAAAGGLVVKLAPIPKLGVVGDVADVSKLVYGMDPLDLRMHNEKILYRMGVSEEAVETLYENRFGTPTTITVLVDALSRMEAVDGRPLFVDQAGRAESKGEVGLLVRSAEILASYDHEERPLARIGDWAHFPHAVAADGRLVVVVAVDNLHWTEDLAALVETATPSLEERLGTTVWEVWIEGGCSDLAASRLSEYGYEVHANAFAR